jgi:hypothetical protein
MTEDHEVRVAPVEGGWCVQSAGVAEMMFLSGARAEEGAKSLAACLARCGMDVNLVVQDRRAQVVGARRYFAAAA